MFLLITSGADNKLAISWPGVVDYLIRIGLVIVVFIVFYFSMKIFKRILTKLLEKKSVKNTFHRFIVNIFRVGAWLLMILVFLQILKVPLTPLVAALGTLGIGLGLALKDHMANVAGGIMIAINKQFDVGDYIKCGETEGFVEDVELFFTRVRTFDNKIIFAPNAIFSSTSVFNYTRENLRRVDVTIGVSYSSGIDNVKKVIEEMLSSYDLVKNEPLPFVGVLNYGDSSINIIVRVWTETKDYWPVFYYITEMIKKEFDKNGIVIPFPQIDVHTK